MLTTLYTQDYDHCTDGDIRLVNNNGTIDQEGHVEVCVNGVWGSICRSGWTLTSAYVACKQLGYQHAGQ